jgi:hypothetical protein
MSTETIACPRRMQETGPWKHQAELDTWVRDRWLADPDQVRRRHDAEDEDGLRRHNERNAAAGEVPITLAEYRARWYVRGPNNGLWLWTGDPPRTCSFCGGIHPEDAIRLVTDGWEVEPTSKSYKRYLVPPGAATRHAAFLASLRDPAREPGQGMPSAWEPTPPVKLYTMHLDADQVRRFNEALDRSTHP